MKEKSCSWEEVTKWQFPQQQHFRAQKPPFCVFRIAKKITKNAVAGEMPTYGQIVGNQTTTS